MEVHRILRVCVRCFLGAVLVSAGCPGQTSVLTQHNDNSRTGANLGETTLNTSNVNVNQFGKLFTQPVDASIYAQPLYVPQVTIPGQGVHNVVYVATMNDSVYAFDADSPLPALWSVNFTDPGAGIIPVPSSAVQPLATDITGNIGVEGTPVIDPSSNTIYLLWGSPTDRSTSRGPATTTTALITDG